MGTRGSWRVGTSLALLAFLTAAAAETDWPQWRGPGRDGISAERSGWPRGWPPKKLWDAQVGYGCTSPIVVEGRLYVMGWDGKRDIGRNPVGTDTVFCFDARTGRVLWKQSYPCRYHPRKRSGDLGQYGGPNSTPTLDRDTGWLYTLSLDGDLRIWDTRQQGKLVWARNLYTLYDPPQRPDVGHGRRDFGFPTSPLILGDRLFLEVGATDQGTVMAFDKRTGERAWASEYRGFAGHTGGLIPMQVEGIDCLAVLTLRELVVLRRDPGHEGETLATAPWTTDFACNIPTPAVAGSRLLVTSGYNHSHASLFAIANGQANKLWTTKRAHAVASSPVIYRGRAYMVGGQLYCVDLASGKPLWRGGSFGNGNCLVTRGDDKLLVFGRGRLALVEARPERDEYRELHATGRLLRGTCYPQVTLSNGVLVCKDRNGAMVVLSVRAVPDTTAPRVLSATAAGTPTEVRVRFSEPVDPQTAQDTANYAIDYDVQVRDATLSDDGRSVTLTVSTLHEGGTYTLTVRNILDRAEKPNRLAAPAKAPLRYTPTRRATDGLVALYRFNEGKGTTVADASGTGPALDLTIRDPSAVRWTTAGLVIAKPAIIQSASPPKKLIDACRRSNAVTVEAWLRPANTDQRGPARIVSLSKDPYQRNLTLGQERDGYDVRLRTTTTGENGKNPSLGAGGCATRTLSHVVYTRDAKGKAHLYVNAAVKAERTIGGDLGNWDTAHRFALANELTRDRPWLGTLRLVALYARALTPDEVAMHHRAGP